MIDYTFICPYCLQRANIIERCLIIRDTRMIGFYQYEGFDYPHPEFSADEDFDTDGGEYSYVCSNCEHELRTTYEQLYNYIKEHGSLTVTEVT
jgi:hypothetical protein